MRPEELVEKGGIYFERIRRGMEEYSFQSLHLGEKEAYETLKKERDSRGEGKAFADFYYFYLEEEPKALVRENLSQEELAYLEELSDDQEEGNLIYPLEDMLLGIIVKLNAREVLFSTVYFLDDASTWWGNYKEEYIVFRR